MRGLGRLIAHKRRELKDARKQLKEARIFLEEDLHNVLLQKEVARLELVIRKKYIARGTRIHSLLQWIDKGDVGSKFYFYYLKRKVSSKRVLGLWRDDGSMEEDSSKIRNIFGLHFQNIFSPLSTFWEGY